MTNQEHVAAIEGATRDLIGQLKAAEGAGVSYALVLPAMIAVMRSEGFMLDLNSLPSLPGLTA